MHILHFFVAQHLAQRLLNAHLQASAQDSALHSGCTKHASHIASIYCLIVCNGQPFACRLVAVAVLMLPTRSFTEYSALGISIMPPSVCMAAMTRRSAAKSNLNCSCLRFIYGGEDSAPAPGWMPNSPRCLSVLPGQLAMPPQCSQSCRTHGTDQRKQRLVPSLRPYCAVCVDLEQSLAVLAVVWIRAHLEVSASFDSETPCLTGTPLRDTANSQVRLRFHHHRCRNWRAKATVSTGIMMMLSCAPIDTTLTRPLRSRPDRRHTTTGHSGSNPPSHAVDEGTAWYALRVAVQAAVTVDLHLACPFMNSASTVGLHAINRPSV